MATLRAFTIEINGVKTFITDAKTAAQVAKQLKDALAETRIGSAAYTDLEKKLASVLVAQDKLKESLKQTKEELKRTGFPDEEAENYKNRLEEIQNELRELDQLSDADFAAGLDGSLNTLNEVKDAIRLTNDELNNAERNTDVYDQLTRRLGALRQIQKEVRDETRATGKAFEDQKLPVNSLRALEIRYGQLIKEIRELDRVEEAVKFNNTVKEAATLKDEINKIRFSIGDFRGDVGNYGRAVESLQKFLTASVLLGGLRDLFGGVQRLGNELARLSTNILSAGIEADTFARKSLVVLGEAYDFVSDRARQNANDIGLTNEQYIAASTNIADLLVPMGFARQTAAEFSTDLVDLSGALAEWSGGTKTAEDAQNALSKALLGEREQLKEFGVLIREADVSARLAAKGQSELTGELLQQAKATATLELILERSADAQRAYAENSDTLARRVSRIQATFATAGQTISTAFIPIWSAILAAVEPVTRLFTNRLPDALGGIGELFAPVVSSIQNLGQAFTDGLTEGSQFGETIGNAINGGLTVFVNIISGVVDGLANLVSGINTARDETGQFRDDTSATVRVVVLLLEALARAPEFIDNLVRSFAPISNLVGSIVSAFVNLIDTGGILNRIFSTISNQLVNFVPLITALVANYTLLGRAQRLNLTITQFLNKAIAENTVIQAANTAGKRIAQAATTAYGVATQLLTGQISFSTAAATAFRAVMATLGGPIGVVIAAIGALGSALVFYNSNNADAIELERQKDQLNKDLKNSLEQVANAQKELNGQVENYSSLSVVERRELLENIKARKSEAIAILEAAEARRQSIFEQANEATILQQLKNQVLGFGNSARTTALNIADGFKNSIEATSGATDQINKLKKEIDELGETENRVNTINNAFSDALKIQGDTTASLREKQRLLQTALDNTARNSEEYTKIQKELAAVQNELSTTDPNAIAPPPPPATLSAYAQLKKDISDLEENIQNAILTGRDYSAEQEKLIALNRTLAGATDEFKTNITDQVTAVTIAEGSLKFLSNEVARLKKELEGVSPEKAGDLAKQLVDAEVALAEGQKKIDEIKKELTPKTDAEVLQSRLDAIELEKEQQIAALNEVGLSQEEFESERQRITLDTEEKILEAKLKVAKDGSLQQLQIENELATKRKEIIQKANAEALANRILDIEKEKLKRIEDANTSIEDKDELERELARIELEYDQRVRKEKLSRDELSKKERIDLQKEIAEAEQEIRENTEEDESATQQTRLERIAELALKINEGLNIASGVLNEVANLSKAINDKRIAEIEERYDREIDAAEGNKEVQERLAKERDEAIKKIEKKAFERQQRFAKVQAVINGALAVTKILAEVPKADFGISTGILIAAAIATTALQVAAISQQKFEGKKGLIHQLISNGDQDGLSQVLNAPPKQRKALAYKFAKGGRVELGKFASGKMHSQGGIKFNAGGKNLEIENNEFVDLDENGNLMVLNQVSSRKFRPQLEAIAGTSFEGKGAYMNAINMDGGHGKDLLGTTGPAAALNVSAIAQDGVAVPNVADAISNTGRSSGEIMVNAELNITDEQFERLEAATRDGSREGATLSFNEVINTAQNLKDLEESAGF